MFLCESTETTLFCNGRIKRVLKERSFDAKQSFLISLSPHSFRGRWTAAAPC
jgi:hypothetical protein